VSFLPPAPPAPAALRALGAAIDWSVVAIGGVMVALVFANVVLHLFHRDNPWTTEFCEFLMVWVTFLGAAAATRRGAHMTISEFVDRLRPHARRGADLAIAALAAALLVLLVWYGVGIVRATWANELTVLGWPMGLQYLALPAGSAATLVFVLWDAWQIGQGVPREVRYPA
jgi:TRAP-type C4-dicarboxylate transport system permease small subunit